MVFYDGLSDDLSDVTAGSEELKKFYDLLKRDHKMPISLIHGDVNVANVLISEKDTYLINFEKACFLYLHWICIIWLRFIIRFLE